MLDDETHTFLTTLLLPPRFDETVTILSRVLVESLGARSSDELLIISDTGWEGKQCAPLLARGYLEAGKSLGMKPLVVLQSPTSSSETASSDVVEALNTFDRTGIILALLSNKLGNLRGLTQSYRKLLTARKQRYATTPSLGFLSTKNFSLVINALNVDSVVLRKKHSLLREQLMNANIITVTTPAGTNLTITEAGIPISSDGDYRTPGTGGNLPAGEVFLPVENCTGTIVIDGSVRTEKDTYTTTKTILSVNDGVVVSIEGGEEATALRESLEKAKRRAEYPERVARVCEFGIGLNENAILSGTTILDEKAIGTAHIAIGSNYWFGGKNKTIIHYDQVFRNPTVVVDGKRILW